MSSAVRFPTRIASSRRTGILAAASALVAAASITVTLAAGIGDTDAGPPPSTGKGTAAPDRATVYQRSVETSKAIGTTSGPSAAERFHHFH